MFIYSGVVLFFHASRSKRKVLSAALGGRGVLSRTGGWVR